MTAALRVRDVRARYGPVEVLHGVDLDVAEGAVTAVLGRNGAGKTTLLNVLAGLKSASAGTVRLDGTAIGGIGTQQRARQGLLLIPDRGGVFEHLTVAENLRLFAGKESIDVAVTTFPILGRRLTQLAGTLSGGEQQMLALSRALLQPFRVLLVDELSRGLAPAVVEQLYDVLAALTGQRRAIVAVDQDAQAALRLASIVYVLRRGSLAFGGEPVDLPADHGR